MGKTVRRVNREFDIRPKNEPYRKAKGLEKLKGISSDVVNELYEVDDDDYDDDE